MSDAFHQNVGPQTRPPAPPPPDKKQKHLTGFRVPFLFRRLAGEVQSVSIKRLFPLISFNTDGQNPFRSSCGRNPKLDHRLRLVIHTMNFHWFTNMGRIKLMIWLGAKLRSFKHTYPSLPHWQQPFGPFKGIQHFFLKPVVCDLC